MEGIRKEGTEEGIPYGRNGRRNSIWFQNHLLIIRIYEFMNLLIIIYIVINFK